MQGTDFEDIEEIDQDDSQMISEPKKLTKGDQQRQH